MQLNEYYVPVVLIELSKPETVVINSQVLKYS
jgi:hypothetical protein